MKVLVKLMIPPGVAVEKEVVKLGQTVVVVRLGRFVGVLVVTLESVSIILNILSRKDFLSLISSLYSKFPDVHKNALMKTNTNIINDFISNNDL